jgi:hypothetical protein
MDTIPVQVVEYQGFSEDSFVHVIYIPRNSTKPETLRRKLEEGITPHEPLHKMPQAPEKENSNPLKPGFKPVKNEGQGGFIFP